MKKKLTAVALIVCMLAIMLVGASLAYFTDDEQVTNTMTIGNVEINIDEYTYSDGKWAPFENDKFVLYPIDNAQGDALLNKIVYTANVSSSKDAAYIRNIVLIEKNDLLPADYDSEGDDCCFPGVHFGYAENDTTVSGTDGKTYTGSTSVKLDETVTIDGNEYWVAVFTQKNGEAIPYDAALMSLSEVWMDKNITSEQIEGWYQVRNGKVVDDKVDIIVFSQGIQEEGLTHEQAMEALGEVNQENLTKWLTGDDTDFVANDWTTKTKPAA